VPLTPDVGEWKWHTQRGHQGEEGSIISLCVRGALIISSVTFLMHNATRYAQAIYVWLVEDQTIRASSASLIVSPRRIIPTYESLSDMLVFMEF
jgi:hypothetical protein